MPHRIHIPNHLIFPFGTAHKFDLSKIRLSSVGGNGIYFSSDVSCVYIDRNLKQPLTMYGYKVLPNPDGIKEPDGEDVQEGIAFIQRLIQKSMPDATRYQCQFLKLYFDCILHLATKRGRTHTDAPNPMSAYNALLPIPEMQIYVHDPLEEGWSVFEPTNNFRVDFGFWTGQKIIAVEIDGHEPNGYARDVRRDRLLRRANVDVIHIFNTEIKVHGGRVIGTLLPDELTRQWHKLAPRSLPPFSSL